MTNSFIVYSAERQLNKTGTDAVAWRFTIAFCVLTALCEGIDLQAAGVAAAGIGAEFKPTSEQFGTFFSASTLGLFFGALIGGRLADSIGRKKVLVTSVALFGLFSLLTSLAWSIPSLIITRALTGLGLGGALPMMLALVAESSDVKQQAGRVAMVYAATPFGGAIVSLLSLLMAGTQWRTIFVVGGVLPLILAPVMALALPESSAFRRIRATANGASLPDVADMPKPGSFMAIFSAGRALRTTFLWTSFFLGLLLLYLLLNWLPTLLTSDGLSRTQAAGAQIGFNIGGALSAILIGHLINGRLRNWAVIITFVALPILLVTLAKSPAQLAIICANVFLLGCAVVAAQAFLYAMAPAAYPTSIRGVGVGAAVAMGRIGSIVGPKLGGMLKAAGHSPSQLLMDLLPIVVAGSICALLLAWEVRRVTRLSAE
jgi:MFS transporter, AAHS family, 3-hydroxyphenylpropionic acid transporter